MKIKHIVNVSGGKDSTATLLFAIERLGKDGFDAVFADTQHEHKDTYEYLDYLEEALGLKIRRVTANFTEALAFKKANIRENWAKEGVSEEVINRAEASLVPSGNAYLDLCKLHAGFPSRMVKFCTYELKIEPIYDYVIEPLLQEGYHIIQWLGVRRSESRKRADTPLYLIDRKWGRPKEGQNSLEFNRHKGLFKPNLITKFYPLRHWSIGDVFEYALLKGIMPNPLYAKGMARVGCAPCIMARNKETEWMLRDGMIYDRLEFWEQEVHKSTRRTNQRSSSFFAVQKVPGTLKRYQDGGNPASIAEVKKYLQRGLPQDQEEMEFENCEAGYCD